MIARIATTTMTVVILSISLCWQLWDLPPAYPDRGDRHVKRTIVRPAGGDSQAVAGVSERVGSPGLQPGTSCATAGVLDAYLLPRPDGLERPDTVYGRAPFAMTPLRDVRDGTGKGLVRRPAVREDDGEADDDRAGDLRDYDFYSREEIDALARAAASDHDAAVHLAAAMTGLRRGSWWRCAGGTSTSRVRRSGCGRLRLRGARDAEEREDPQCSDGPRRRPSARAAWPAGDVHRRRGSGVRKRGRTPPRRERAAPSVHDHPAAGEAVAAAVPPAAPLLRLDGRQQGGVAGAGSVVDGSLAHPDDGALYAKSQAGDAALLAKAFAAGRPWSGGQTGFELVIWAARPGRAAQP